MAEPSAMGAFMVQEEVERFFAKRPSPQQIVAFHLTERTSERLYELVGRKRDGVLTENERQELETYESIEYRVRAAKSGAYRQLQEQASR